MYNYKACFIYSWIKNNLSLLLEAVRFFIKYLSKERPLAQGWYGNRCWTGDHLRVNTRERDVIVSHLPAEIFPEYILVRVNEFDKVALTPLDEWIEYLKDGTIRPDTTAPGLKEAREKLKYYSMSPQERLIYDRHLDAIMIQNDVIDTAKWEGRIEGKAEGLAEGMRQVASKMKNTGVDIATIVKCTGLSEEIILSL